jgi:hypothetical protein
VEAGVGSLTRGGNDVIHTVTLRGEVDYSGQMPPAPIGRLLIQVPAVVQQAIRMGFQGRSTARGPRPEWLSAMSDVRVLDVSGDQDAVVRFEAPQFGEAARELYDQQELWPTRPEPEDTGFDLLGDILSDVGEQNTDSDRFDHQLLRRMEAFSRVVNGEFREMLFTGHRYSESRPAVMNQQIIETARRFYSSTPAPTTVRVVGDLDMIRGSTRSFALRLGDGHEVNGVLVGGEIERLAALFRRRVLVAGEATFRVSGRLLRVDAQTITPAEDESSIWSRMPQASTRTLDLRELRKPQGPRSGMAAIIGQWPGDETDEEIEAFLRQIS